MDKNEAGHLVADVRRPAERRARKEDLGAKPAMRTERRRPGRPEHVSPHLVALLRHPTTILLPPAPLIYRDDESDGLGPLILGSAAVVLLSAAIWYVLSPAGLAVFG